MSQIKLFGEYANLPRIPVTGYSAPTNFPNLFGARRLSLDLETSGLDPRRGGQIVGIGLRTDDHPGGYWPIRHVVGENCPATQTLAWLRDGLKSYKGEIVGANVALFDSDFLGQEQIFAPLATWRDVQWAEPLLDESAPSYALEDLGAKYLGFGKYDKLGEIYGKDWKKHFAEIHPAHATPYVETDISLPLNVLDKQLACLRAEGLSDLYDLECSIAPLLQYMKRLGIRIDLGGAEKLKVQLSEQIRALHTEINELAGGDVNYHPSASLFAAFDKLKIKYPRTKKDNPSCTADWLETQEHPFCQKLVELQEYDKILGTFIQGYILDGNLNGRVHATFNPLRRADSQGTRGTVSGRFSSTDPNLQNIPIRTELGKQIRALFLPDLGHLFASSDYSQLEYRLMVHFAYVSGCRGAEIPRNMYRSDPNTDYHKMIQDLTGLDRIPAKTINFGILYGMGLDKLARSLKVTRTKAGELREIYFDRAPYAKEIFDQAMQVAQDRGYVRTILGRRARFNVFETNPWTGMQQRARTHKALNAILQGSNADMIKRAMSKIWSSGLIYEGGPLQLHLTIHDELCFSVSDDSYGREALAEANHIMETAIPLEVPVLVSGGVGANWAEAH